MADPNLSALSTARAFPDAVPILIDAEADVTLRAPDRSDLHAIVEQCRDPEMIRWTTVPTPPDGYQLRDAEEFFALTAAGWTSGQRLSWTIEARRDGGRGCCGGINLDLEGDGVAEVGFGLHPQARGRSIMTAALQLVCDYGFEIAGLRLIRWRAMVGNWASRRVAANVGFVFDGTVRSLLVQRGELQDGWIATLVRDDPRVPQPWLHPIEMHGPTMYVMPPPDGGVLIPPSAITPLARIDVVDRYLRFEYLPRTEANLALTDIRAQHPNATVADD